MEVWQFGSARIVLAQDMKQEQAKAQAVTLMKAFLQNRCYAAQNLQIYMHFMYFEVFSPQLSRISQSVLHGCHSYFIPGFIILLE